MSTLERNSRFDILDINEHTVLIKLHSTGNERKPARKRIEGVWNELISLGHISLVRINSRYTARHPAYVAAILAEMDGVTHTIKPIELTIHRPS